MQEILTEDSEPEIESEPIPLNRETLDSEADESSAGSPGQGISTENFEASEPVEFEPHPPGTPGRELMAPGFEDISTIGPMQKKNIISGPDPVNGILDVWFSSEKSVIVLYLFESRAYCKFEVGAGQSLKDTLENLMTDHFFLVIDDYGVRALDLRDVYQKAVGEKLLLVARKAKPTKRKSGTEPTRPADIDSIHTIRTWYFLSHGKTVIGKRKRKNQTRRDREVRIRNGHSIQHPPKRKRVDASLMGSVHSSDSEL
ncbi:hypothetical protein N7495_001970 [Penicillium taxi]|uniref:uncharacterized protein n=1 Tax=Penicillium taxi TaxID=168475 RepID=UPI0025456094|nr:uncharacterized protein N7495_001970 [Penicillium taxi]KAJ5901442.1 hypothetical protein N7495_001970 [Penicillium taxi]